MKVRKTKTTLITQPATKSWYHVDATNQVLGRLASRIAMVLMGKHKPSYTSHVDTGDFVVVTNCTKIKITGKKVEQKTYNYFTRYPGGYKQVSWSKMLEKHPDRLLRLVVKRMLPKNALGQRMLKKLKAYAGDEHPHQAQQPEPMKYKTPRCER